MEVVKPNLKIAVKALKEGKVLVCPTDTVYGLICDAKNQKAVEKLFKIKKRPVSKPIPIFVKDIKMAKKFSEISSEQERLLKEFWPGKTTVILKPKRKLPKGIGKDGKEIGLRIPNYKFLLSLMKYINGPLAQTSANISGKPASGNIKKVMKQFFLNVEKPDLVVNLGNLSPSKSSQIVNLTIWPPKIIRA